MLTAAFILVFSVAALIQFAVFSWRAGLMRVASQPLASQAGSDAAISDNSLNQNDFADVSSVQEICPALSATSGVNLTLVRAYHSLMSGLNSVAATILPSSDEWMGWTQREMALCTRYSNVVLSQRLQRNQRTADEVRSYYSPSLPLN
jgi:hypothetical protein